MPVPTDRERLDFGVSAAERPCATDTRTASGPHPPGWIKSLPPRFNEQVQRCPVPMLWLGISWVNRYAAARPFLTSSDIHAVQELLGCSDVATEMNFTHVPWKGRGTVRRRIDALTETWIASKADRADIPFMGGTGFTRPSP
jgi:hypothetical protein